MKYECDLIRDLMPLCADDAASESSKKAVQTHIAVCTECAREWDSICGELTVSADAPPPEAKYADAARRYRNKRAILIFIGFLVMLGLTSLFMWLTAVFDPLPGFPTPEQALDDTIRIQYAYTISGIPDYDIKFQYEWTDDENMQNIIYFVLPKNRNYYHFVDVKQIDGQEKGGGRYHENGSMQGVYDTAQPLIIFAANGYQSHRMPETSYYIVSGMTQDAKVTSVELKHYGTVQTFTPDETGFFWGIFPFPEDFGIGYTGGDTNYARAYDADGNLLYELTADDKGLQTYGGSVSP